MGYFSKEYWWDLSRPINLNDPIECNWHPADLIDVFASESGAKAVFQVSKNSLLWWFQRPLDEPRELNIEFGDYEKHQQFSGPDIKVLHGRSDFSIIYASETNTKILEFLKSEYLESDGWQDAGARFKKYGFNEKLIRTYQACLSICDDRGLYYLFTFNNDFDTIGYFDLTKPLSSDSMD